MDQDNLASALRALASDEKARPETARLRDVFDDVEAALRSGVRREAVLSALHQQGFKMTLESFKSALQRIRKERAKAGTTLTPIAAPEASKSVTPASKQPPASSSNTKPSPTTSAGDPPASFDWESKRDKKVEW
ncbi:hypothetical protein [Caballeronia grimmiae]|uniref:hypothetical protein n=1 Tax=Caballeronia grimmiae TaxID=1071679 RepID=UPI0038B7CE53